MITHIQMTNVQTEDQRCYGAYPKSYSGDLGAMIHTKGMISETVPIISFLYLQCKMTTCVHFTSCHSTCHRIIIKME